MLSEVSASLRMANAKWKDFYRKTETIDVVAVQKIVRVT